MNSDLIRPRFHFHPVLTGLLALTLYAAMLYIPALDFTLQIPIQHLYIVSLAALIAALIAAAMGVSALRLRNPQVLFISLAFISLTLLFGLHGLTTPGVIFELNPMVGVAAQLSFMLTAVWLYLSSLPSDNRLVAALYRMDRWLLPAWISLLVIFILVSLQNPALGAAIPINQAPVVYGSAALTFSMSLLASSRFWRSFRYARFPIQNAIAHVGVLLAASQVILSTGTVWHISWWLYHALLLIAVALPILGLLQQYNRGQSLALSVSGLFASNPQDFLEAGISPSVRALIAAVEARDPYTAGHTRRVAIGVLRLGQSIGLPPEDLRALAQGALLHDIGKLEMPDDILNHPGKLDDGQMNTIRTHPVKGYELCRRLGFMQEELEIICFHHERFDGSGYPEARSAQDIPLLARLLAVVDVYDALTSDRAYRPAWSHQDAIQHIHDNRGTLFDPECVDAWIQLQRFEQ